MHNIRGLARNLRLYPWAHTASAMIMYPGCTQQYAHYTIYLFEGLIVRRNRNPPPTLDSLVRSFLEKKCVVKVLVVQHQVLCGIPRVYRKMDDADGGGRIAASGSQTRVHGRVVFIVSGYCCCSTSSWSLILCGLPHVFQDATLAPERLLVPAAFRTSAGSCLPESDVDLKEVHHSSLCVPLEIDIPPVLKRSLNNTPGEVEISQIFGARNETKTTPI